jgi:CP family cyanate transporter-like MFS transporter
VTEQPAESSRKAQRLARGGFAIIGILLTATNLRAPLTVVGPLVPALQEQVDMSAVAASNLVTIPVLCFGLASPLAPVLARLMGLERALGAAMAATSLGIVLRSLPGSPFLWGGTILLGCAIAMLNVLLPALIRRDFPLKISQITGWYQVVQTVVAGAAAAFAVPVAGLVDNGWRLAFGVTAGFGMISLAVFWPRIMNPVRQAAPLPLTTGQISVPKSAINPWKSLVGWQVSIFMGLQSSLFYTAITWFPAIEHDAGFTTTEAGAHQGLLQLAGVAGNSMGAWLFARSKQHQLRAMTIASPWGLISLLGLLLLPDLSILWLLSAGFAGGMYIVMAIALMGLRAKNHEQTARLSSMAQSVGYFIAAAVPLLFGSLHDITGGWEVSLIMLTVGQVIMVVSGLLASRDRQI